MRFNRKKIWKNLFKNEILIARCKLFSLFILGFLIGIMLKSQASRTITVGYNDSEILKNDKIEKELIEIKDRNNNIEIN